MSVSLNRLSGIVGVVVREATKKANWAALFCSFLIFSVAAPGLASAQPDVPPIPTPIVEEPVAPQAPEAPSNPAPEVVAPQAPAPEAPPLPPPLPPAPPVIQVPVPPVPPAPPALEPAPQKPEYVPAPPKPTQVQVPDPQTEEAPPPVAPKPPVVNDEPPTQQAPVLPKPSGPTTQVEVSPTETKPSLPSGPSSAPPTPPSEEGVVVVDTPKVAPVVPDQSSSAPSPESEESSKSETTETEQSSPESSSAPEPSDSAVPSSEVAAAKEEPVVLPDTETIKVNEALKAPESDMQALAAKTPDEVSEADQKLVDEALMHTMGSSTTTSSTPTTTTSKPPTTTVTSTTKKPWPDDHDGKPWDCKRGPRGCNWDNWHHDRDGHPVFTNPYKEYWQLIQWLDHLNHRQQVWVPPHSNLPVLLPQGGFYAFAVVTFDQYRGFALSAGFGTFSSPGSIQCVRHPCQAPPRPVVNVSLRFQLELGYGHPQYVVPARDCGCAPVWRDNRQYFTYYVYNHHEVTGYWEQPRGHDRYFVVESERVTPLSPVTSIKRGEAGSPDGLMALIASEQPQSSAAQNQDVDHLANQSDVKRAYWAAAALMVAAIACVAFVVVLRRRNEGGA